MRIQLDVSKPNEKVIKNLMESGNLATYRDLFNTALTVLYWCFQEIRKGRIVASLDEQTMSYKELALPSLQNRHVA